MDTRFVLITFNRAFHTRKVLEAIKREGIREFTIFVDGAEKEEDRSKQQRLYELFNDIDWADYELIQRERDLGLARSVISAVTETLKQHDAVVVLEDDCVPLPGFKNYMLQSLRKYCNNKKIRSVCAYSYTCVLPDKIFEDVYFSDRFCPWGWGTWKDRWNDFDFNLTRLIRQFEAKNLALSAIGRDLQQYCTDDSFLNRQNDIWSLNWIIIHYLTGTFALYPKFSLIDNIGFDGTGIHSEKTNIFTCKYINPHFGQRINYPSKIIVHEEIQGAIANFLAEQSIKTMRCNGSMRIS